MLVALRNVLVPSKTTMSAGSRLLQSRPPTAMAGLGDSLEYNIVNQIRLANALILKNQATDIGLYLFYLLLNTEARAISVRFQMNH